MSDQDKNLSRIDASQIRLRTVSSDEHEVESVELRRSGRYEILGRVAEGGVGTVLKARDADLGRDVALKLLRDKFADNTEILRRFVEEAQIAGQLQHPGIVPIYELGLHDDDRPFFAMKLIKGNTLQALLQNRRQTDDEESRFLDLFTDICRTMAYAHSRGVIHRDLKPANVLVGSFGEVQVVDWGFAKVLEEGGVADERRARRDAREQTLIATVRSSGDGSQSIAGSVMGTPAYMAPEQALGLIDDLDRRTDVFALGAVLCEILTGAPAYVADSTGELLVMASQARLEDAFARLDACGRAPALIDLAKRCLSPMRSKRPENAYELAKAVIAHLSDIEERARQAKLEGIAAREAAARVKAEAMKARARAEEAAVRAQKERTAAEHAKAHADEARGAVREEQRKRRFVQTVGATVILAAVIASFAWGQIAEGRAGRAQETAGSVHGILADARTLKGEERWQEAVREASRAVDLADEADGDDETQAYAKAVRDDIAAGAAAAARIQENDESYGALAERHDETRALIFIRTHDVIRRRFEKIADGMILKDAGRHLPRIYAAFDDWELLGGKPPTADDNAFRKRVKAGRKVPPPDPSKTSARDAAFYGLALLVRGQPDAARAYLHEAQLWHTDDPWVNQWLSVAVIKSKTPRREIALRYLDAARAARPGSQSIAEAIYTLRTGTSDLDLFEGELNYHDESAWFSFEISRSVVTGSRRRFYLPKAAVTLALITHRGGKEWEAAPMEYGTGTMFVAEDIDVRDGAVTATEMIRIRYGQPPQFWLFDDRGMQVNRIQRLNGNPGVTLAPATCIECHTGTGYYDPMQSFPKEPENHKIDLGDRFRDLPIVLKFLEGYHRGGRVFGPYGAIWMCKLKSDARNKRLTDVDREHYNRLRDKYPELMNEK